MRRLHITSRRFESIRANSGQHTSTTSVHPPASRSPPPQLNSTQTTHSWSMPSKRFKRSPIACCLTPTLANIGGPMQSHKWPMSTTASLGQHKVQEANPLDDSTGDPNPYPECDHTMSKIRDAGKIVIDMDAIHADLNGQLDDAMPC
ncbi:hypothetical protein NDA17_003926 [Ustilago hordei]|nr:hypothetical protein NDA17_003926 [Ustilago hordei]